MHIGKPTVELEIVCGQALCKRRLVDGNVFLIGTSSECDLVLAAAGLPEVCAILTPRSDAVGIRDVGEAASLTVNGQSIARAQLADGDKLRIGPFEFAVRIRPARPAAAFEAHAQNAPEAQRWVHHAEALDAAAMSIAARLRADIRAAFAKEQRTLRRPA